MAVVVTTTIGGKPGEINDSSNIGGQRELKSWVPLCVTFAWIINAFLVISDVQMRSVVMLAVKTDDKDYWNFIWLCCISRPMLSLSI